MPLKMQRRFRFVSPVQQHALLLAATVEHRVNHGPARVVVFGVAICGECVDFFDL